MKIAILYICTGKYNQFFKDFHKTAEEFLLQSHHKEYYVFTDDVSIADHLSKEQKDCVHLREKKCLGFPMDSLLRFETFLTVKNELLSYDYVYFFNANTLFLRPVGEEILPDESGIVAGVWEINDRRPNCFKPYEKRKQSTAYIPPYDGPYRYVGGFMNGGTSRAYVEMAEILAKNTQTDLSNGIIAAVHDESHLNAYFHINKGKCLPDYLCRPQEYGITASNSIMLRDKVVLDSYFNKGRKFNITARMKKAYDMIVSAVKWYLYI